MLVSYHLFQFDLPQYSNCSYGDYVQVGTISLHVVTKHLMFLVPGRGRQCDRASTCNSVWGGPNPLCGHLWQQCQVTPQYYTLHIAHCKLHITVPGDPTPNCIQRCPNSKLRLIFHADGADQEKRGFLVKINASVEGGHLDFDLIRVLVLYEVY